MKKLLAVVLFCLPAFGQTVSSGKAVYSGAALFGKSGNFDGPAELPRATVPSAMSGTPAPGSTIVVGSGGNIQTALNNAVCGQTITLAAGTTYTVGQITVPNHGCDINHWIIVETSAYSSLPAEGTRLTPCYSGFASLPGRPSYTCGSPSNTTAQIAYNSTGTGPFKFLAGANYYRFIGLEVTRASGTTGADILFGTSGSGSNVDHIIVDRCWFHGQVGDETYIGLDLDNMTNVAVVDSYLSDFHCISNGICSDAQAITGGVSTTQDGPYKIQDNFLEGSGQGILFGGGAATYTPADIQVLYNHFFKPLTWLPGIISTITESGTAATLTFAATTPTPSAFVPGQSFWIAGSSVSGYNAQWTIGTVAGQVVTFTATSGLGSATGGKAVVVGGQAGSSAPGYPFVVKNHFELKNATRVQFEANLMENVWGGFSQVGWAILLTPKNPGTTPTCNVCQVTDVTIRYSKSSHSGSGITLANVPSDTGGQALAGTRWSIHDIVLDDINALTYGYGDGDVFEILSEWTAASPALNKVTINHVTAFASPSAGTQPGTLAEGGNTYYTTNPMSGFVFTNNIIDVANHYALYSTGGGASNCAYPAGSDPLTILNACFTTYTFNHNAFVNPYSAENTSGHWPSGNFLPVNDAAVDFVNYNNGNGGDYTLQSISPYYHAGTDGKDLGADIAGLNAALANVQ